MNRKISDTELFSLFGLNGRKAVTVTGREQHWLNIGDVISFTSYRPTFDNAEFQINNCRNWTIWFSQLNTPLYNGELNDNLDGLQVCSIRLKTGLQFPFRLNHSKFWDMVRNKRFKVEGVFPCYWPNKENNEVKRMTIIGVYEKVHKAIINGNGSLVRDMLKPTSCYDLIEI
ncbi:MAG: hypothetical protein HDS57_03315 [Barnesiella sp.]|nr:hypothetical protein [Barnesiella sp.]